VGICLPGVNAPLKDPGVWIGAGTVSKLLAHLSQPSTLRGIFLLCSALGVYVRPDIAEAIIAVGMASSGLVGVLTTDPVPPAATE
jgi:hypothetical protein